MIDTSKTNPKKKSITQHNPLIRSTSVWLCCHIVLLAPTGGIFGYMHLQPELPALHRDPGPMLLLVAPVMAQVLVLVLETVVNWWWGGKNEHSPVDSVNIYWTYRGEKSSFGCRRRDARMEGGQLRVGRQRKQRRSFQEGGLRYEGGVSISFRTPCLLPSGEQQFTIYNINEATWLPVSSSSSSSSLYYCMTVTISQPISCILCIWSACSLHHPHQTPSQAACSSGWNRTQHGGWGWTCAREEESQILSWLKGLCAGAFFYYLFEGSAGL